MWRLYICYTLNASTHLALTEFNQFNQKKISTIDGISKKTILHKIIRFTVNNFNKEIFVLQSLQNGFNKKLFCLKS